MLIPTLLCVVSTTLWISETAGGPLPRVADMIVAHGIEGTVELGGVTSAGRHRRRFFRYRDMHFRYADGTTATKNFDVTRLHFSPRALRSQVRDIGGNTLHIRYLSKDKNSFVVVDARLRSG